MIFDIATFVSIKIGTLFALLIAFGLFPLVALFIAWPGYDQLVKTWKGGAVIIAICVPLYVSYLGWIWPFGLPPVKSSHVHLTGYWWQQLASTYDEQLQAEEASRPPTRTELGTELRRYRLDDWTPPKHFYVDLTDLTTGEKHSRIYVSKHCNNASSLRRGEEYNILLRKYELSNQPGVVRYEFVSLYDTFC